MEGEQQDIVDLWIDRKRAQGLEAKLVVPEPRYGLTTWHVLVRASSPSLMEALGEREVRFRTATGQVYYGRATVRPAAYHGDFHELRGMGDLRKEPE